MIKNKERHNIKKGHKLYNECDRVCFLSKNLYNYSNYIVRQEFIRTSNLFKRLDENKKQLSELKTLVEELKRANKKIDLRNPVISELTNLNNL